MMTDSLGFLVGVAALWLAIGLALSVVMSRRGHDGFSWFVLGTLLGPFGVILAIDAWRHDEERRPASMATGARGSWHGGQRCSGPHASGVAGTLSAGGPSS